MHESMLHHQSNLTISVSSQGHPEHSKQILNSQNVFLYYLQRVEIILYSSRLNGGNAGNVRFDIATIA